MEVFELLVDLIKIPSTSGREKAVGEYLVNRLKRNFNVKIQTVGERFNILATKGNPKVLLTTHMDTVASQIPIGEDETWIYGRGACDAKGCIAGMVCACEKAVEKGLNDFGIMFDVSEETDFAGILEAQDLVNPQFVIIGEPTDLKIVFGQKGIMQFKVKCYGKSAHGSKPESGISAITKLIKTLNEVMKIEFEEDELLGKTTLNIGLINGGIGANVVADYAEAVIEVRTTKPNEEILEKIRSVVPEDSLEIVFSYERALNEEINYIKSFDFENITVPYFTEMYFWSNKSKTIVFGPGSIEFAHSNEEKVKKEELAKSIECYFEMIKEFTKENL